MRITVKHLELKIDHLNKITGNAATPWTKNGDGKFKANIGNYHLSGAYGGVCLHQMHSDGGGVSDVFNCGHVPKADLYSRISAFMIGLDERK